MVTDKPLAAAEEEPGGAMMVAGSSDDVSSAMIERAQRGDAEALEQLLRLSYPRLRRKATRLLKDPDAAEDAVQNTVLRLSQNIGQLIAPAAFWSWAGTTLRREAIQSIRRSHRTSGTSTSIDTIELQDPAPVPEETIIARDEIARSLRRLPGDDRRLLDMHYWNELEVKEIAATLGIAVGAVKTRLFRARNRLRELLCEPEISLNMPAR